MSPSCYLSPMASAKAKTAKTHKASTNLQKYRALLSLSANITARYTKTMTREANDATNALHFQNHGVAISLPGG
jgi:hypothetical protein